MMVGSVLMRFLLDLQRAASGTRRAVGRVNRAPYVSCPMQVKLSPEVEGAQGADQSSSRTSASLWHDTHQRGHFPPFAH